jgi:quercetin dioxygenase-like cupin family protein
VYSAAEPPFDASQSAPQLSDISIGGDPLAVGHHSPSHPEHPSTVAGFAGLARALAADRARWAPLVQYDPVSRWYARLAASSETAVSSGAAMSSGTEAPGYEVWLLSWLPGQGSGLHDHGRSSGVLTVLEGTLTERSLTPAAGEVHRELRPGSQRVFAPGYLHEVVNDTLEPAVSLHVYFPGLTEMTRYPHPPHVCSTPVLPLTGESR